MTTLQIRPMRPSDIPIAIEWAAAEGWNPGLNDAACFATVDTDGFLIGELDGEPAATISCVNYDSRFSFLGFYIVRQDLRGRGYGLQIWNEAIRHAGSRAIGLDGVVAQQRNYERSGFVHAYANVRYCGTLTAPQDMPDNVIDLSDVPLLQIEASDAMVFPAQRRAFLRSWIGAPGHIGRALIRDGDLAAWGVIRPCRIGYKIGPLVAFDRAAAESRTGRTGRRHRRRRGVSGCASRQCGGGRVGEPPWARPRVRDCAHVYRADSAAAAGTRVRGHQLRTGLAARLRRARLLPVVMPEALVGDFLGGDIGEANCKMVA